VWIQSYLAVLESTRLQGLPALEGSYPFHDVSGPLSVLLVGAAPLQENTAFDFGCRSSIMVLLLVVVMVTGAWVMMMMMMTMRVKESPGTVRYRTGGMRHLSQHGRTGLSDFAHRSGSKSGETTTARGTAGAAGRSLRRMMTMAVS
jgi:hypothetical protein